MRVKNRIKVFIAAIVSIGVLSSPITAKCNDGKAQKLVKAYSQIVGCKDNYIIFRDGTKMLYDDGKRKSFQELLNHPDIEDMFIYPYPRGVTSFAPPKNDPGRIRYEPLFRKIYGNSAAAVRKNLTTINWFGKAVRVTKVNGVAGQLLAVERELKKLPKSYWKYLTPIGGTFTWRKIAGTNRLSVHSFGAAIDINVKYSAYWRWSKGGKYSNQIPHEIVNIFERHGFIWGGKWKHYDTMHFEYRPELLY